MASKKLLRLAKSAASASAKAAAAQSAWVEAFKVEYGHDDISDALVGIIDYSMGDSESLTQEFIEQNSAPGRS